MAKEPIARERKAAEENGFGPLYAGMSEQQVFDAVTRPEDIPGMEEWGIPKAVDPEECSPQLKVGRALPLHRLYYCLILRRLLPRATTQRPEGTAERTKETHLKRADTTGQGCAIFIVKIL